MTDRARELVERLRHVERLRSAFEQARQRMNDARPDPVHATPAGRALYDERYQAYNIAAFEMACGGFLTQAADLIEQSLTPPEGDTVSEGVVERVAKALCDFNGDDWNREGPGGLDGYRQMASAALAALQSRVSPQAGMREALEGARKALVHILGGALSLPRFATSEAQDAIAQIDAALSTAPIPMSEDAVELRAALKEALDMVVDAARDGFYSVNEFKALAALSASRMSEDARSAALRGTNAA